MNKRKILDQVRRVWNISFNIFFFEKYFSFYNNIKYL